MPQTWAISIMADASIREGGAINIDLTILGDIS